MIHAIHHLVAHTVNVGMSTIKQYAPVCQNTKDNRQIVNQNVLLVQNVHKTKLVINSNAQTLAKVLVVLVPNAK